MSTFPEPRVCPVMMHVERVKHGDQDVDVRQSGLPGDSSRRRFTSVMVARPAALPVGRSRMSLRVDAAPDFVMAVRTSSEMTLPLASESCLA